MNIVDMPIGELKEYDNNPRINDSAVDPVANSIQEFGFKNPIIIDSDNVIIAGHTRLKAAQKLGLKEVPCIVADDLTDEQVKAFRLADNKVAELALWDMELLNIELEDLDMDMSGFGFYESNLPDLSDFFDEPEEAEEKEEKEEKHDYILTVVCESEEDMETLRLELEDNGYTVR